MTEIDDAFFADVINLNAFGANADALCATALKVAAQASGETSAVILVGSVAAHLGGGPGASLLRWGQGLAAQRAEKTG